MADIDNAIDGYLGQQRQQSVEGLKLSVSNALSINPDQEALARKAANTLQIPVDTARDNLDEAQQRARMKTTDFGMLSDRFPKTSSYLTDQQNANLSHDDVGNLSNLESLFSSETPRIKQLKPALEQIGGFAKNTGKAIISAAPTFNEGAWGLLRAGSEFLPDVIGKPVTGFATQMGQESRAIKNDLMPKADGTLESSWYSGMQSLGLNLLQLPLGITGKMAPILTSMGLTTGGQAYGEARDQGVDKTTALAYGTSQGVIEAGTEMIGLPALFSLLKPGHFGTKAFEYLLKEQGGEQIATALQDLNDWAILPENKDKSISDYLKARPEAALQTALATAFGGGGQIALMKSIQLATARGEVQVMQAENSAQIIGNLNELASASNTLRRDPESFEKFIEHVSEDGPVQEVFINANVLMQSGFAEQVAQLSPSVAEQLPIAINTGGQIAIPVAEYAARIAPTEYASALIDHLKTDPEGWTRAEAQEYMKSKGDELRFEVERLLESSGKDQAFKESKDRVYQMVLDNLNETNRFTQQKNEVDASLIAARTAVRAAQLNMTPEELFNKHLLKVTGDTVTGNQVFHQAQKVDQEIEKWSKGELDGKDIIDFGTPSKTLKQFGVDDLPIQLTAEILKKARDKHNLQHSDLKGIYEATQNPLAVFASKKGNKNLVVLTEIRHKDGNVLVAINLNTNRGHIDIHDIRSIHPKADKSINHWINDGLLLGYEKTKGRDWLERNSGSNSPRDQTKAALTKATVYENQNLGNSYNQSGLNQTETPEFKQWFGDSKVVDADGNPLVVYHGSRNGDFSVFDPGESNPTLNGGMYFSSSKEFAQKFAGPNGKVFEVYLRIENPLFGGFDRSGVGANMQPSEGRDGGIFTKRQSDNYGKKGIKEYIVFDPAQIKSAIGNNGKFDADNPNILHQPARGQIAFGSDISQSPSIITLLKSADLSTFLHESGHFFFESDINLAAELNRIAMETGDSFMNDGERQLMADVSKMMEWHGLQGSLNDQLNQWYNLSPEEKRAYHERTAESFERYLFEGKAPSIELQRIFKAFRAWLMNVYKIVTSKEFVEKYPEAGKLDDSIRQVFDRMLASSEEIQLAEQGRSMMPLFESADQAGMTTEEFAAYHALDLDASMEAIASLETKGLRDLQWLHNARSKFIKKLQKQNAARRAEVMIDARREILKQPLYRAWTFLTNRMDKDQKVVPEALPKSDKDTVTPEVDSLFMAIAKLGGLKRDEIDALLGLDPKMKSPMPAFGKYVFKKNGGESLDFMGEVLANYGYLSVDEHGKFDTRELEDKLDAELRGEPQYSMSVDPRVLGQEGRAGEGLNLEEIGAGRLDFGELVGLPVPRDQINQLEALKVVAMNGIHPDLVAEQFGISSGDELVQSLLTNPNPKEAIANLTDQMMLERYGDITSPEALEKAADAAIHNEARAKFVATELNALNKATGKPKVLVSAAKEFAKNMIDRLIIRNLKPSPYAASEVRAAKAAEKALKAGNIEQAAAEKRNQIINTYATKAVYDAQDEVEKGLHYLSKFDNEGTRKALDVDYLDQIDAILERFDLRKGTTLKSIDKRKSLAAWIDQQEALGIEVDLPNKVKAEAYRQSYKDMTVEELRGLIDSIKQIEHLGRLKEKLLTAQDNRRFSDIINQMVESIEESSNHRQVNNRTRDTIGNKAIRLFKGFFAAHRKTASLARELDGYKEKGPMWECLIRTMNKAGDREASMRADATERLAALLDPILKGGKFGGKGQFFQSVNESLNRGEQLVIALNMGNAGNFQRLLDGRGWQVEQLVPVMKNLTTADWNFVQSIWDFFESYRPMIAEKERRIMGKEPNWVEPQSLIVPTKEGTQLELRGGYFPIVYDPRESGRAEQFADAEAAKQMMRGAFNAATTRRSFTKDRADEVVGRPLILTWDALFRGVNDVIHDLAWHEWVIDANRIIKNESLDHAIRTGFGTDVIAQFKSAISDIAKGDSPDMDTMSKVLTPLRSGAAVAGLGFNLMNAMLQPLGLTQSMVRIGSKWVALGITEWAKSPIGLVKQVHEKSEFMRNRARTLNREVNEVQSIVQGKGEIREKLDALMFAPMQSLQLVADMPTWWGAYQKALADPTLIDAENGVDEATAIARADQAVLDSQGGGQIKDLARVQRGGNLQKLFTLFYGYFSAAYNLGVDQAKQTNFKSPLEVMGLAWDFLLLYSVPSVLASLLKDALMPSGSGDDDWETLAKKLVSEQISYLMGLMIGLREATGAIQYATGTKMFDTAYGGPAGLRFFQELDKLGKQIGQGELDRALARSAINVGGVLLHLPSAQINRTVDGVVAISEGKTENPAALLFGFSK